ncbi:MAG: histidinol dehydrogenase [Methanobrevibacter sp.]|jgi:histidinol dehydrogenase|nr:histidinol dehydrogenase [Candidatus Methanovirga aequatorialis]
MELFLEVANQYAPEHIQIITKNSKEDANKIVNSGSVCIGEYSPVAAGDYLSGANNVIPTGKGNIMFSPVHVESYMKCTQTQHLTKESLKNIDKGLKTISDIEEFSANYNSVDIRLN